MADSHGDGIGRQADAEPRFVEFPARSSGLLASYALLAPRGISTDSTMRQIQSAQPVFSETADEEHAWETLNRIHSRLVVDLFLLSHSKGM